MQPWRQEFELDGINSGSWYLCLPVRVRVRVSCTVVVYEVVFYMEVRPGL